MFYELATLSGPLLKLGEIDAAAQEWMADAAAGTVLGRWRTDIGQLGKYLFCASSTAGNISAKNAAAHCWIAIPSGSADLPPPLLRRATKAFRFWPPPRRDGQAAYTSFEPIS